MAQYSMHRFHVDSTQRAPPETAHFPLSLSSNGVLEPSKNRGSIYTPKFERKSRELLHDTVIRNFFESGWATASARAAHLFDCPPLLALLARFAALTPSLTHLLRARGTVEYLIFLCPGSYCMRERVAENRVIHRVRD